MLTTASALTDVAEFTFDVDDHLYRSVGMGASAIGALMAATGVSSICSGGVAKTLIHKLGPAGYTLLANCAFILSMLMKGFATTPLMVFLALIPYTLGPMGARSSCINSLHTAEATAAGMAKGELMAAREVFFTILKMVVPLAYARLYAMGQRLPFIFAGGLCALAQLMLFTVKGAGAPITAS